MTFFGGIAGILLIWIWTEPEEVGFWLSRVRRGGQVGTRAAVRELKQEQRERERQARQRRREARKASP